MSDERKVKKKEAENERHGQVKQRKHHMKFISAAIVYLAALSNPTHSEISDTNLFSFDPISPSRLFPPAI